MNLTFGICWIEDQATDVETRLLETAVRECGFEPKIVRGHTDEEIRGFATRQEHFHDFDLILLDLTLGDGRQGDDLAPAIRRDFRSTPILFYSAAEERSLREMMAEKLVDGVYCAQRNSLAVRVSELITDWSPALNRLPGMRGLAAQVVAECDQEFREILNHLAGGENVEADLVRSLKDRVKAAGHKSYENIKDIDTVANLLTHRSVSSGNLFNEVKDRIGDEGQSDQIKAVRRELRSYPNKMLERRNLLAHALEKRGPSGWTIVRPDASADLTASDFQRYRPTSCRSSPVFGNFASFWSARIPTKVSPTASASKGGTALPT